MFLISLLFILQPSGIFLENKAAEIAIIL
jgi:hypothetical protein